MKHKEFKLLLKTLNVKSFFLENLKLINKRIQNKSQYFFTSIKIVIKILLFCLSFILVSLFDYKHSNVLHALCKHGKNNM